MDARPRLLDQVRDRLRTLHYSYRTEQSYLFWVRRFILYSDRRHPSTMGGPEVERFLTHLTVERGVSASTRSQALAALLFLYRQVLQIELPWLENVVRAKPSQRLHLEQVNDRHRVATACGYGAGIPVQRHPASPPA
jgi:Phage integrase, N-terminal SAM-like domain